MSGRKAGLLETAPQFQRRRTRAATPSDQRRRLPETRTLGRYGDVMTIGEIGLGYMGQRFLATAQHHARVFGNSDPRYLAQQYAWCCDEAQCERSRAIAERVISSH